MSDKSKIILDETPKKKNHFKSAGNEVKNMSRRRKMVTALLVLILILFVQGILVYKFGINHGAEQQRIADQDKIAGNRDAISANKEGRFTQAGKVTTVDDKSITIKTSSDKEGLSVIDANTIIQKTDGTKMEAKDIPKGSTVIISGTTHDGKPLASRIRVAS